MKKLMNIFKTVEEVKDWIHCNWCEWEGCVPIGMDICPSCGKEGYLKWVDENKKEVNSVYYTNSGGPGGYIKKG